MSDITTSDDTTIAFVALTTAQPLTGRGDILEIAIVITGGDTLTELARTHRYVYPDVSTPPSAVLAAIDYDNTAALLEHGLLEHYFTSAPITLADADEQLSQFIADLNLPSKPILGGFTIPTLRGRLKTSFPRLADSLHYRSFDLDSIGSFATILGADIIVPTTEDHARMRATEVADSARDHLSAWTDAITAGELADQPHSDRPIVSVDVETTGLTPASNHLLEVGLIITDGLDTPAHTTCRTLTRPVGYTADDVLADANDYVTAMHRDSGLADEYLGADIDTYAVTDAALAAMLTDALPEGAQPYFAGSSLTLDTEFLTAFQPTFYAALQPTHRPLDASAIALFTSRITSVTRPETGTEHRALDDAQSSLDYIAACARAIRQR